MWNSHPWPERPVVCGFAYFPQFARPQEFIGHHIAAHSKLKPTSYGFHSHVNHAWCHMCPCIFGLIQKTRRSWKARSHSCSKTKRIYIYCLFSYTSMYTYQIISKLSKKLHGLVKCPSTDHNMHSFTGRTHNISFEILICVFRRSNITNEYFAFVNCSHSSNYENALPLSHPIACCISHQSLATQRIIRLIRNVLHMRQHHSPSWRVLTNARVFIRSCVNSWLKSDANALEPPVGYWMETAAPSNRFDN